MTLDDVLSFIEMMDTGAENFYCGTLNAKKDKSIGVYQLKGARPRNVAVGGADCTKTGVKGVSLLVHWNSNSRETELVARKIYDLLADVRGVVIGGYPVSYFEMLQAEPIDVGADDHGVFERVVEFNVFYENDGDEFAYCDWCTACLQKCF